MSRYLNKYWSILIMILIMIIGALLRLPGLDKYPAGFSGDEAQQGYDAYSLLQTGKDAWGEFLPLFPRGFGDYKPPIYTYAAVPSVALLGLNETATRFPAALAGLLTILVTYFLVKEWWGDKWIAILSALLLSISPWHVQLSRTAFEGSFGILFFVLGLWMYFKSRENQKFLLISALCFGLTLYTYHPFRIFTPLFIIAVLFLDRKALHFKKIIIPIMLVTLMVLPIVVNFNKSFARFADVGIGKGSTSTNGRFLEKVFDGPILATGDQFFNNYISYFSPTFFFTGARPTDNYLNFPSLPLVYPVEIIFLLMFVVESVMKRKKEFIYAFLWLLLAPIPAAATASEAVNRVVTFIPLISVMSAVGCVSMIQLLNKKLRLSVKILSFVFLIILFFGLGSLIYQYIYVLPNRSFNSLRTGYRQIFVEAIAKKNAYQSIVFTHSFTEPQIFIAFYEKTDPRFFQLAAHDWLRYEKSGKMYVDQLDSYSLGKFEFRNIAWNDERTKGGILFAGKSADFPGDVSAIYKTMNNKNEVLFELVESDANKDKRI